MPGNLQTLFLFFYQTRYQDLKDHIALEQLRNVEEKWHDAHARVKYVMVQAQSAASRAKRRRMLYKKKQREFDEQRKKLLMMRDLNSEINIGSQKSSGSGSGSGDSTSTSISTSTNKKMKNKNKSKSNHSLASKVIAATKSTMRQPRKSSSDKENVKENGSTEKGEVVKKEEDVFRLRQNLNDCNLRNIQVLAEKKKKEATLNSLDTNQYGDDEKMDALALQYMHLPPGMRTKLLREILKNRRKQWNLQQDEEYRLHSNKVQTHRAINVGDVRKMLQDGLHASELEKETIVRWKRQPLQMWSSVVPDLNWAIDIAVTHCVWDC